VQSNDHDNDHHNDNDQREPPMKIAVFGATGATGRQFVQQASDKGHELRVLVRPTSAELDVPGIERVNGDVLDLTTVQATVKDADAVVCILGLPKGEGTTVSQGTATIVEAMKAEGVSRLAVVTVQGLNDSRDRSGFFGKVIVAKLAKARFEDRARQEDVVFASGLPYTVLRPSRLADGERTGKVRIAPDTKTGMSAKTVRADLAEALLTIVETGAHVGEAVTVTSS
jgi:putative NADH-flavin reductase